MLTYTVQLHAFTGCSPIAVKYEGDDLRKDARKYAASLLRRRRKQGYRVSTLHKGREWEISEPEDAVMIDDNAGILTLRESGSPYHYVAMAGLHGCMPNVCDVYLSAEDAAEGMASLHELGKKRTAVLKRALYLELNLKRDGNEYIEIQGCDCDDMEAHSDY